MIRWSRFVIAAIAALVAFMPGLADAGGAAGEFAETVVQVGGLRTVMWALVGSALIAAMIAAVLAVLGRDWVDGVKKVGVVLIVATMIGVPFVRVMAPIVAEAATPAPLTLEEDIDG